MRYVSLSLIIVLLSACSGGPFAPEEKQPVQQSRAESCAGGSSPSQSDCGHFPAPDFH